MPGDFTSWEKTKARQNTIADDVTQVSLEDNCPGCGHNSLAWFAEYAVILADGSECSSLTCCDCGYATYFDREEPEEGED